MRNYLLTCIILLATAACATHPPTARPPATLPPVPEIERDLAALREAVASDLEQSAMNETRTPAPRFDAEAIASIEIPSHPSIDGAVRYFSTGLKPSIQQSLIRSAAYKEMIDRVLDEQRIPRAFAYLPVIESAYLPNLTSKAGARGIWQFMPATAREYGLRVDWWIDDRVDPQRSTVAAARYLKDLYRMFSDWPLALAAYNCGPGRVRRTLAEHEASTFWELHEKSALPKETRGYVPTFFATVAIAGSPETFGFELRDPIQGVGDGWDEVEIRGPLSLEFIAEVAGAEAELLRSRNLRYHRGLVPPGVHPVTVPRASVSAIAERRDHLRDEDPRAEVASYTLRPGQSLAALARLTGAKLEDVLAMNDASTDRFRPGDSVYLPVRQTALSALLLDGRGAGPETHVVEKGETLYSIARTYNLTVSDIAAMNDLESGSVIHPGQRLRVNSSGAHSAGM